MPRTKKRETKQKSIAIQTDNTDNTDGNIEIIRLQEQLKLLQLENDTLKKHVNGSISFVKDSSDKNILESVQSPQRINKFPRGNSQVLKSATKSKICTCKGNCSNKICGCVKNERKCGPACKCDDQTCQNQEVENKENLEAPQNEILRKAHKSENAPLKDKTEYKHLFSPEGIENGAHLSNAQFEDICFDTQKKLTYISDEELQNENKSKIRNDIAKKRNKKQKKNKNIDDAEHATVSERNITIKAQKPNKNEVSNNQAGELNKFESKIIQSSPLSEEDNKMSTLEADTSFDPMKPKRQLPRTPPRDNIGYEPAAVLTTVETPTEKSEQKVDLIPDELNQENVDLKKLHIELVSCDRCKRKFYPWRIAVHKSACHGL